jgi:hypothetical protein
LPGTGVDTCRFLLLGEAIALMTGGPLCGEDV